MQQDGVKPLQGDKESLKEKLCLVIIDRDRSDSVARMFKNCTVVSLIGPKVSKTIGWNTYDPANAAYLVCFLDAAFSAAAATEDAEVEV